MRLRSCLSVWLLLAAGAYTAVAMTNGVATPANGGVVTQALAELGLDREPGDVTFTAVPDEVEAAIEHVSSVALNGGGMWDLAHIATLVHFTQSPTNHGVAWKLRPRWSASGAATVSVLDTPFEPCIRFAYSTNIPDYAVLPCSLRYSEDAPESTGVFVRCVAMPPPSNGVVHGSFLCREETTPNLQSGTSYRYTTRRHLIRACVDGVDTLITFSDMQGKSSFARRGIAVGPAEHDVYYYSERVGTNLRGLQWVKARMNMSRSMVVWAPAESNATAFAAFSWVNAGWRQLNVTRTHHIYEVLEKILAMRIALARSPGLTEESAAAVVARVLHMPTNEVERAYAKYCEYVKYWRDVERSQAGLTSLYQPNSLLSIYDEGELARMPFHLRQALVIQEEVRALRGVPSWSADGATTNKPANAGWKRFLRL